MTRKNKTNIMKINSLSCEEQINLQNHSHVIHIKEHISSKQITKNVFISPEIKEKNRSSHQISLVIKDKPIERKKFIFDEF